MGEIGISRREYLYVLSFCDLLLISRGYDRRNRHLWSAIRWQTHQLMAAFVGGNKLTEAGIHSPKDLIAFPWEFFARKPKVEMQRSHWIMRAADRA